MTTEFTANETIRRTCDRLSENFGTQFSLWRRDSEGWTSEDAEAQYSPELTERLDRLAAQAGHEPRLFQNRSGRSLLAAAYRDQDGMQVLVCGELTLNPETLAKRLFAASADRALLEGDNEARRLLLDDYSSRMIDGLEEMTFLRRLTQHMEYCDATRSLRDVAVAVLPQLRQLMQVEALGLVSAEAGAEGAPSMAGRLIHQEGEFAGEERDWRLIVDQQTLGRTGIVVRNMKNDLHDSWSCSVAGVQSLVIAPVTKDSAVFGWLVGVNKLPKRLGNATPSNSLSDCEIGSVETSLLEAAASMFGSHATNCRLFHEKEELILSLVSTLVGVIEAKDPYTCGHSDRVALLSRRLAQQMGLANEICEEIYHAGLLHDVGKVGVSDDVLLKPGKVTDAEFAQIKRHPEIGARLLRGLRPFEKLIPGVLHHHENLDGTGYPHGLKNEEIPLMARVLAVADAFDAMTSDRPYRTGMPFGKAEQILRDGAGKQWDPAVVDAYFAARDDLRNITQQWQDHLEQVLAPPLRKPHDPVMGRRQSSALREFDATNSKEPACSLELAGV